MTLPKRLEERRINLSSKEVAVRWLGIGLFAGLGWFCVYRGVVEPLQPRGLLIGIVIGTVLQALAMRQVWALHRLISPGR